MCAMKFKKNILVALIGTTVLTIAGCSTNPFRDRGYDYAREQVVLNPPLQVPESVSTNPNIKPRFKIDEQAQVFAANQLQQTDFAMEPPAYNRQYDIGYLLQLQQNRVESSIYINPDNQPELIVRKPLAEAFEVASVGLQDLDNFNYQSEDKQLHEISVQNRQNQTTYVLKVKQRKDHDDESTIRVYNEQGEVVTSLVANTLLDQLSRKISSQQLTEDDMEAASSGYNITPTGIKFLYFRQNNITALVFVTAGQSIDELLKQAIEKAGYTVDSQNATDRTMQISKDGQKYQIYMYQYIKEGSWFSDMSNWNNLFKSQEVQTRVSVFDMNNIILPPEQAEPILLSIEHEIPVGGI